MKNQIKEELLNQLIESTVKKHLRESYEMDNEMEGFEDEDDPQGLMYEYVHTTERFLEKIKHFLNHPDTRFMLGEDETAFEHAKGCLEHAKELYDYLKGNLDTSKAIPKKAAKYDEKDFKKPIYTKDPSPEQMNENRNRT
jgi:hypothetical protein